MSKLMNETWGGKMRVFVGLTLLFCSCCETMNAQSGLDSLAVTFTLFSVEGKQQTLEEIMGSKLTMIVFWATWGKDSSRMLEDAQRYFNKYSENGFQVIGVCVDSQSMEESEQQKIKDTVTRKQLTFPVLFDDSLKTFHEYSVIAVPTTFIIDTEKQIVFKLAGYTIVGRTELDSFLIEQFEGKRPVAMKKTGYSPNKEALRMCNMSRLKYNQGRLEEAKKYADKANNLDSLYADPLLVMAEIAIEDSQYAVAESTISLAIKRDTQLVDALYLSGLLLAKQGKQREGVALLLSLIQKDTLAALAYCYLGYAMGVAGDFEKSLKAFERAEILLKEEFRIPFYRAEVYRRMGEKQKAEQEKIKAKQFRVRR